MSKQYSAILIDAQNREVKHVTITDDISTIHKQMGCDCFCQGFRLPNHDICLVDDEGMINGTDVFFTFEGAHQPFAGNGLISGGRSNGDTDNVKITIDEVKAKVKFYTRNEIAAMYR